MTDPLAQYEVCLTVWHRKKVCDSLSGCIGHHLSADPNGIRRAVYTYLRRCGINMGDVYEDTLELKWDHIYGVIYASIIVKKRVNVERKLKEAQEKK